MPRATSSRVPHCTTLSPPLQDGNLPFNLALQAGCSAPLLALLEPGSAAWLADSICQPLVSTAEIKVFGSLSHLLDPNPRRLKRIISVYSLVSQVAKVMPLSEGSAQASHEMTRARHTTPHYATLRYAIPSHRALS